MKLLSTFSLVVAFKLVFLTGSIHDFSVPKIEGGTQSLSAYQGKKILIITLPLSQTVSTDSMLYALDTLATAHTSTLKVIAVPSYEDGYTPAQKSALTAWYRSMLGTGIVITEGLYTRRTSGGQQHPLFAWLTKESQNELFDIDIEGPGYKYFAKGNGQLYGVLRPASKISGLSVQKTLRIQ